MLDSAHIGTLPENYKMQGARNYGIACPFPDNDFIGVDNAIAD